MELTDFLTWSRSSRAEQEDAALILGNPPYTRHQHLDPDTKRSARECAGGLVDSGLAGLSTYFAAATLSMLQPQDSACLLLPGNWCQARYGRPLREWLWAATRRRVRIQHFPATAEIFPGTQVTAMVLFVGPECSRAQKIWFDRLELVDPTSAERRKDAVRLTKAITRDRREACPAVFTPGAAEARPVENDDRSTTTLSDVARIRRGVATGVNKFFFLTDRDAERFPRELLAPALVKASQAPGLHLDGPTHDAIGAAGGRRWLLTIPENYEPSGEVAAYLRAGVAQGYAERYLTRNRQVWFSVEKVAPPDLFVAPFARQTHRVIVNGVAAVGSNNLFGVYLRDGSGWQPAELAKWLISDEATERAAALGRSYQGRSHKLEPGDLAALRLPRRPARSTA